VGQALGPHQNLGGIGRGGRLGGRHGREKQVFGMGLLHWVDTVWSAPSVSTRGEGTNMGQLILAVNNN
jgi:hypothetical protein